MQPRISIIIVSYHATPLTHLCLWSLAVSNLKHSEVIVVDNAMDDPFLKELKTHYPFFQIIHNPQNEGFGKACNKGHQMARGEISLFLNPDTIVPSDFENQILTFFETHPKCGAMGAKMIDGTGRFLPESKRNFPTPMSAFLKFSELYRIIPKEQGQFHYYATQIQMNQVGKIPVLSGAFIAVSRHAIEKTGGFDPRFFMYSEDIDLSWQISESGLEVWYNPGIEIIHFKGETAIRSPKFSSMFFDSMQLFNKKHYGNKHSRLFFILTTLIIQTFKFFSFLKYSIKKRIPQKHSNLFILDPNSSARCIKKLQDSGYAVKIAVSNSKESFLPVSSNEIKPDQIIHLLTGRKKIKNRILFLHEESGWLFQLNNKEELVKTFKLTNVK
jgi:N-acetylglucosaminyl-diphospho-decaprenol L-rhamnosyltransferase